MWSMVSDYHFQTQENETIVYTVPKWKSYVKDLLQRYPISQHFLSNLKTRLNSVLFFPASLLQLDCLYNDHSRLKQGKWTKQKTDYHFQPQELMLNKHDHWCQFLQESDVYFRDLLYHDAAPLCNMAQLSGKLLFLIFYVHVTVHRDRFP
jgi:hypothetical protein